MYLSVGELALAVEPLPDSLFHAARSAAWDGDSVKVPSLLYSDPDYRPTPIQLSEVLQCASITGELNIAIALMDSGADVNYKGQGGATALQYCSKYWRSDPLFFELLKRGADPLARDSAGTTALHYAAMGGHVSVLQVLVAKGLDVNIRDSASQTPLHFAAVSNNSEGARYLLGAGADINAEDINGLTPIVRAWRVGVEVRGSIEGPDFYDREGTRTWGAPDVFYTLLEAGASTSGIDWKAHQTLLRLAEHDNTTGLVFAIQQGANLVFPDSVTTPLHVAARFDCSQITAFLLGYTGSPDPKNELDETPLIVASRYGAIKCAKVLIEAGADVNYHPKPVKRDVGHREWIVGHRAIEYLSPLLWSYKNNHSALSVLLIQRGADPNSIPQNWDPLIFTAATRQDTAMIDALIEYGVNVNAQSVADPSFPAGGYNYTALEQTIRAGNLFLAKKLIRAGASLTLHSKDGYYDKQSGLPHLHRMVAVGNMEILHWLIAEGFDPNWKDDAGQTAAFQAAERNDLRMLCALEEAGTDFKLLNNNSESLLHAAVRSGSEEALVYALQKNLDPNAKNLAGLTPLCSIGQFRPASTDSNLVNMWTAKVRRIAEHLIKAGSDAKGLNGGVNVLNYAFSIGHSILARIALEQGADPSGVDRNGNTYLHRFASNFYGYGKGWMADLLIEFGADPNATNKDGDTPILVAAAHNNQSMPDTSYFRALARGGANLEARNRAGGTALTDVVDESNVEIARVLLETGANPDPKNPNGSYPLGYAVNMRDVPCAKALLDFGANPNRRQPWSFHRPYLGSAALDSYFDIVRILLAHGADPNLTDDSLNTPLHLAACSGYPNEGGWCIEALLAAGANPFLKNIQGDTALDIARKRGVASNAVLLEKAMRKK